MSEEIKKELENEEELEQQEQEEETEGEEKEEGKKEKSAKTFSQEQVNQLIAKENKLGKSSVYKELGIDPKDSKAIALVKALIASQKTEEQKRMEKEAEDNEKMQEAEQRAIKAEAKAEAMMLGVKAQYVDDVVTLALAKATDDVDVKTLIGEFKTKYPVWFGEPDDEKGKETKNEKKTGQKGTGSSFKTSKKDKKENEKGLGARLAAQRRGGTKKFSYWSNN